MNNELTVKINSKNHKVFLQNGFYSHCTPSIRLHKHNYAEIHIVAESETELIIGTKTHCAKDGNLLVIPRETSHSYRQDTVSCHCAAFQINFPFTEFSSRKVSKEIVLEFLEEIKLCEKSGNYTRIVAFISLFCSFFTEDPTLSATPITDYSFLIEEFFSNRYSENVHLVDLAKTLHLCPRQAERLVIKHTGNTFRQELCDIRLRTAKYLQDNTNMSLSQICNYVGYQSYAGFFKAMKKQRD